MKRKQRDLKYRLTQIAVRIFLLCFGVFCAITVKWFSLAEEPVINLNIENGTTTVENYAYSMQYALQTVSVPDSVNYIGISAFEGCGALTDIQIGAQTQVIDSRAFAKCISISEVNIPQSVTKIGNAAFYGCFSLQNVNLPSNISTLENSVFYQCSALSYITIPDSVKRIGRQCFYGCTALQSVTLPEGLETIDEGAFNDCISLGSVSIPDSVQSIGADAFTNCPNINILCQSGSYAEQYAQQNGLKYSAVSKAGTPLNEEQNVPEESSRVPVKSEYKPPKTGVNTPYELVGCIMLSAAVIFIFLKKKENELELE